MPSLLDLIRRDAGMQKLKENVKDVGTGIARTPGNLAGSLVDLIRLFAPNSSEVGSSDWINKKAGIPETKTTAGKSAELAASLIDPKNLVGAGAGIIAAGSAANRLHLDEVLERVMNMSADGKSPWQTSRESAKMIKERGNPYGAQSMFIAPDGTPRLVLDNAHARLQTGNLDKKTNRSGTRITELAPKDDSVKLSDILLHPGAFVAHPELLDTTVARMHPLLELMGHKGMYVPPANEMYLAETVSSYDGRLYAPEELLKTMLHETGHAIQYPNKMIGGTSTDPARLLSDLKEAPQSAMTDRWMQQIEGMMRRGTRTKEDDALLHQIYRSKYGEWEAEAGAKYQGKTFPADYLPATVWYNKPK